MKSSRKERSAQGSKDVSDSRPARTSTSSARPRGRAKTRSRATEKTGYAAAWCDDYDCDFGVYKVFRSRGKCIDYLVDVIFERAKALGVDVTDSGARPVRNESGDLEFPPMTREQVRDQLGGGLDFSLVLSVEYLGGDIAPGDTVTMGVREVSVE